MPTLLALDFYIITDEERIEDVSFGQRFKALGDFMKIKMPTYDSTLSAEEHLFSLEID
jgi:hypothetical protein